MSVCTLRVIPLKQVICSVAGDVGENSSELIACSRTAVLTMEIADQSCPGINSKRSISIPVRHSAQYKLYDNCTTIHLMCIPMIDQHRVS